MFLSPAQSQHIPQILDFSHKASALAAKRVAVAGVLTCGNTAVGGGPAEERGQCQSTMRRRKGRGGQRGGPGRGRGQSWWARLIKGLVSYHGPRVKTSGLQLCVLPLCSLIGHVASAAMVQAQDATSWKRRPG